MIHLTQLYCNAQINTFGLVASATNSIGNRIYRLLHVGTTSIAASTGAMIGQNLGARKIERTREYCLFYNIHQKQTDYSFDRLKPSGPGYSSSHGTLRLF